MTERQLPGAGLPTLEKNLLNFAFKAMSKVISDRAALKRFKRESLILEKIFDEDDSYDVFQPLTIPRVIGIEDSSRDWSIAMVLEHLCLVNRELCVAVESLSKGTVPRGEVDIALYKPDVDVDVDVIGRFRSVNAHYVAVIETLLDARGRLKDRPKFLHPWFGYLGPHEWHLLAAFHQRIHRRQAQKIVAMLGVT